MDAKHIHVAVMVAVALAGAGALLAQTPAQTFALTCARCHGPAGTPNPAMVRSMGPMLDFASIRAPREYLAKAILWVQLGAPQGGRQTGPIRPEELRACD